MMTIFAGRLTPQASVDVAINTLSLPFKNKSWTSSLSLVLNPKHIIKYMYYGI